MTSLSPATLSSFFWTNLRCSQARQDMEFWVFTGSSLSETYLDILYLLGTALWRLSKLPQPTSSQNFLLAMVEGFEFPMVLEHYSPGTNWPQEVVRLEWLKDFDDEGYQCATSNYAQTREASAPPETDHTVGWFLNSVRFEPMCST